MGILVQRSYRAMILCCVAAWLSLSGCDRAASSPSQTSLPEPSAHRAESSKALLDSALTLLTRDKQFGQDAFNQAREMLNQWLRRRDADEPLNLNLNKQVQQRLEPLLSAEQLAAVTSDRFESGDAEHLRNCFLLRDVAWQAQGEALNDLQRARSVFAWVVRNLHPVEGEEDFALGAADTLLRGRGDVLERAAVFLALLRQLKINGALLTYDPVVSGAGAGQAPDGRPLRLPVALIDRDLYLFDIEKGVPVANADGTGVATLRSCLEDPEILSRHFAQSGSEATDLAEATLFIQSNPLFFAPRMRLLQAKLAGELGAVFYLELAAPDSAVSTEQQLAEGLFERFAEVAGGAVPLERVRLWPRAMELDQQRRSGGVRYEQQRLRAMAPLFQVTFPGEENERLFDQARIEQLRGQFDEAIPHLQRVRVRSNDTENVRAVQKRFRENASEDSAYWIALCLYEKKDYASAASWFRLYLKQYPSGRWTTGARKLLSQADQKASL